MTSPDCAQGVERAKQARCRYQPAQRQTGRCREKPEQHGGSAMVSRAGQTQQGFNGTEGQTQEDGWDYQGPYSQPHPAGAGHRTAFAFTLLALVPAAAAREPSRRR